MRTRVQVCGHLDVPAVRWPREAGIWLCVLGPVAYAVLRLGWRGVGPIRDLIAILGIVGPVGLTASGVGLVLLALAARGYLKARRLDLEVGEAGFALIGRDGRSEVRDDRVTDLGLDPRLAAVGSVFLQRGRASIGIEGRDGPERIDLNWRYDDASGDPLAGLFARLLDRLRDRADRAIDAGGRLEGDGWDLSSAGLRVARGGDPLPFDRVGHAECLDGELRVWRRGEAGPVRRFPAGSRNVAVLGAILETRKPPGPAPAIPGLGRILFERRPTVVARVGLWLICSLLAAIIGLALVGLPGRIGTPALVALWALGLASPWPALIQQCARFRLHERGISGSGLFGSPELPFFDLGRVVARTTPEAGVFRLIFRPIEGRGRRRMALHLRRTDPAFDLLADRLPVPIEGA